MSMYLEISGRASGKTSRLTSAAVDYVLADFNNHSVIVTIDQNHREYIKKRAVPINRMHFYTCSQEYRRDFLGISNVRFFFDEFLFFNKNWYDFDENGYYVSTPNSFIGTRNNKGKMIFDRKTFLGKLLIANNNYYEHYLSKNLYSLHLSNERKLLEIEGKFLT